MAVSGRPALSQPQGTHLAVVPRTPIAPRLEALDACRAVAVLSMLFANLMNVFLRVVPSMLAHNQGDSLRVFDFPAPFFQFLSGVSLVLFLGSSP